MREAGWVNASVDFTAEYKDAKGKRDGWLIYNADSEDNNADNGVGGYTPQLRFALADSDNEVGVALAGPAFPTLVLPPHLIGKSSKEDAFCVVVSAVDKLGNESGLPDAGEACVKADVYETTDGDETTYAAGLLAGVDTQAPTITFTSTSPKADATALREFQVHVADEGSKIRGNTPVSMTAKVRNEDGTEKVEGLELEISLPLATTKGLNPGANTGTGYYTFSAKTVDKAGNSSEEIVRTALHDIPPPAASTIVGDYDEKTGTYSLIATVTGACQRQ